jgi:hypothetical protein
MSKEEVCTKLTKQDADADKRLHNLKRRFARERGNITCFVKEIGKFMDTTTLEDCEYFKDRLRETSDRLTNLDDEIHELFDDSEYDADLQKYEKYIESAKRAILRTSRQMERHLATSTANVTITDTREAAATIAPIVPPATIRLPPIKLEPFSGDKETWARFWEQFKQSIDNDPSLTTINKHIFLRGYLEEETKHFVEGIAVVAETYEETKKILEARYSDKNRIIQAHLDYLEDVTPIKYATPEALNSTYIDCNQRIQVLRSLGEDVNGYGRVLAPKVLRDFPDDMLPLGCSRQAGRNFRRGHSPINGISRRGSGWRPHHTEDPWQVFQLIRLHFHRGNASRTRQVCRASTEGHSRARTVLYILQFSQSLGSGL